MDREEAMRLALKVLLEVLRVALEASRLAPPPSSWDE
jgi:hypothetical protein